MRLAVLDEYLQAESNPIVEEEKEKKMKGKEGGRREKGSS